MKEEVHQLKEDLKVLKNMIQEKVEQMDDKSKGIEKGKSLLKFLIDYSIHIHKYTNEVLLYFMDLSKFCKVNDIIMGNSIAAY